MACTFDDSSPISSRKKLVELGYLASAHGDPAAPSVAFNLQPRKTGLDASVYRPSRDS